MTVTIDQAMRGAMRYADNEVIPHLPGGKGIGAGIMLALIMEGSREKILALREKHGIYMAGSGRINVAGLTTGNIDQFIDALKDVAEG